MEVARSSGIILIYITNVYAIYTTTMHSRRTYSDTLTSVLYMGLSVIKILPLASYRTTNPGPVIFRKRDDPNRTCIVSSSYGVLQSCEYSSLLISIIFPVHNNTIIYSIVRIHHTSGISQLRKESNLIPQLCYISRNYDHNSIDAVFNTHCILIILNIH